MTVSGLVELSPLDLELLVLLHDGGKGTPQTVSVPNLTLANSASDSGAVI